MRSAGLPHAAGSTLARLVFEAKTTLLGKLHDAIKPLAIDAPRVCLDPHLRLKSRGGAYWESTGTDLMQSTKRDDEAIKRWADFYAEYARRVGELPHPPDDEYSRRDDGHPFWALWGEVRTPPRGGRTRLGRAPSRPRALLWLMCGGSRAPRGVWRTCGACRA